MNKKNKLLISLVASTFSAGLVSASPEVTAKITHESAKYTKELGSLAKTKALGSSSGHGKDTFKSETSARIYIDGALEDEAGSTYHVELQGFHDGDAVNNLDSNEAYTQRDPLREAYVDTTLNDWNLRLGKQQVVWGTADGMKLLDMINPTDFTEMAQNQMEDSRIPVWMMNAEKALEDGGNFQVIINQPKENIFAGLDRNINTASRDNGTSLLSTTFDNSTDTWGSYTYGGAPSGTGASATFDTTDVSNAASTPGHSQGAPFILKGVDSITGKSNGFVNIVPDIGSIAGRFYNQFCQDSTYDCEKLQTAAFIDVGTFAGLGASTIAGAFSDYDVMYQFAKDSGGGEMDGAQILGGFASAYDTNLLNATAGSGSDSWRTNVDSTFEYMDRATFATFDAFAGAKSQYVYNMPKDSDIDYAMKYSNTTKDGTNYSFNYSYAYDKNPIINLSWRDSSTGALLKQNYSRGAGAFDGGVASTTVYLTNQAGTTRYGAYGDSGTSAGSPTLRFEQTVERAHNIGGSFDTTIETESLGPVVIRGEAVYQKDVYSPVMDLARLSIGDLPNALTMVKGDRFKYVIGADITALTNMMVSLQFIQDRNLDYIDGNAPNISDTNLSTSVTSVNTSLPYSRGKFTTDYATMHLTNGFNKAEENKDFVSLYLSKPYGESGQHRWNNIFIFEENGGKWNRLDTEYTVDDNTVATVEWNRYWGDENTQFGQLKKSSNIQLGVKYIF
jgi:hypothetical protein